MKCAILVNSCDKNNDAWKPFFSLFNKYWNNCPYIIYLNTEHEQYEDRNLNIITLNQKEQKNIPWGKRLKSCLKRINAEYVIFLLEDFFFLDYVDQPEIEKVIEWMDKNKNISCFNFYVNKEIMSVDDFKFFGYGIRPKNGKYLVRCQASLWRKKDLIKYIIPSHNPWQFEKFGTELAKLYGKKFYSCINKNVCPFKYDVSIETGYGLVQGKWLTSNIDLFNKENIGCINFNNLGLISKDEVIWPIHVAPKKTIKEKVLFFLRSGDDEEPCIHFFRWLLMLFYNPRRFWILLKKKMRYLFL